MLMVLSAVAYVGVIGSNMKDNNNSGHHSNISLLVCSVFELHFKHQMWKPLQTFRAIINHLNKESTQKRD